MTEPAPIASRTGMVDRRFGGRTHCHRGHEFTPENTKWVIGKGKPYKTCRTCLRVRRRKQQKARYHSDPEYRARRVEKTARWRAAQRERNDRHV